MKPVFNIVILISKIQENKELIKVWLFDFCCVESHEPCFLYLRIMKLNYKHEVRKNILNKLSRNVPNSITDIYK